MGKTSNRPSFKHFGIRYSGWGGEFKSYCYHCDYESSYGRRGKVVRSAVMHVERVHQFHEKKEQDQ